MHERPLPTLSAFPRTRCPARHGERTNPHRYLMSVPDHRYRGRLRCPPKRIARQKQLCSSLSTLCARRRLLRCSRSDPAAECCQADHKRRDNDEPLNDSVHGHLTQQTEISAGEIEQEDRGAGQAFPPVSPSPHVLRGMAGSPRSSGRAPLAGRRPTACPATLARPPLSGRPCPAAPFRATKSA